MGELQYEVVGNRRGPRGKEGPAGPNTVPTDAQIAAVLSSLETEGGVALGRVTERVITPQMFGAVGDGIADDTGAVQAAVGAATLSASQANGEYPPYTGIPPKVLFPVGTYLVDEIRVPRGIEMIGQGGGTTAKATLLQRSGGQNIVKLVGENPALNLVTNSTLFDNLAFKSAEAGATPDVAQISAGAIRSDSVYIRRCWFKTPETWAVWMPQGDDLQIDSNTFDVSGKGAVRLGHNNTGVVSHARVENNTFFQINEEHIRVECAYGVVINGNSAYSALPGNTGEPPSGGVFVSLDGIGVKRGITVTGNDVSRVRGFMRAHTDAQQVQAVSVNGNTVTALTGYILSLLGSGVMYELAMLGNTFDSAAVSGQAGSAFPTAPFVAAADAGLQVSTIAHNTVIAGETTPRMFDMPSVKVTGNVIRDNPNLRFTALHNFANPGANGAA